MIIFYRRLLDEIDALVCGDERYPVDRTKLEREIKPTHIVVVSSLSPAIAPVVGASAPIIVPVVVLVLLTVGRMGVKAWCGTRQELKKTRSPSIT